MSSKVSVEKFSTGTVQIRPQHVGPTKLPTLLWLMIASRWTEPRPINVYAVKHPEGVVVFDSGQDRASVTDSNYFPKGLVGWLYARLAKFAIASGETFAQGLASLQISTVEIKHLVISHLHQDHIGGLPEIAGKKISVVVSAEELSATKKAGALLDGYMANHIELEGISFTTPRFADISNLSIPGFEIGWDVFNDGRLVVLPLHGHTEGSLGVLVNWQDEHPVFLAGDLTYDASLLARGLVPGVGKRRQLREVSARVLALKTVRPKLVIAAAHDPGVVLPQASK